MKKFAIFAIVALVMAFSASAFAQAEPGDLGVFFDAEGLTSTAIVPAAYMPFNVYVLAFDIVGDMMSYEFGLQFSGVAPVALQNVFTGVQNFGSGSFDYAVGVGSCVAPAGVYQLVYLQLMYMAAPAADTTICLIPGTVDSFTPSGPGYAHCSGDLQHFGIGQDGGEFYPDGCAVINATHLGPVATPETSWGAVKAQF